MIHGKLPKEEVFPEYYESSENRIIFLVNIKPQELISRNGRHYQHPYPYLSMNHHFSRQNSSFCHLSVQDNLQKISEPLSPPTFSSWSYLFWDSPLKIGETKVMDSAHILTHSELKLLFNKSFIYATQNSMIDKSMSRKFSTWYLISKKQGTELTILNIIFPCSTSNLLTDLIKNLLWGCYLYYFLIPFISWQKEESQSS